MLENVREHADEIWSTRVGGEVTTDVVLLAGGVGARLGEGRPKQLLLLNGVPILRHSLDLLDSIAFIRHISIVAPAGWVDEVTRCAAEAVRRHSYTVWVGGSSRNSSIKRALNDPSLGAATLLVHDAVRPFATAEVFARVLEALAAAPVAIPVIGSNDALVEVSDSVVTAYHDRSRVMLMQSPQGFDRGLLKRALECVDDDTLGSYATALEVIAAHDPAVDIVTVQGDRVNFKITHHDDYRLAELLVAKRSETSEH